MSLNLNHVSLAGNLTRDPEVRQVNERPVANFSIAINRRYKTADGEQKEEVTFVDCEAWGRTAEVVGQYLTKGSGCYVDGRLKLDSWQDKDGQKRTRMKVVTDNVQFLGSRPKAGDPAAEGAEPRSAPEPRTSGTPAGEPARFRGKPATRPLAQPAGAFPAQLDDEQPPF